MSFLAVTIERHKERNRILAIGTSAGAFYYSRETFTTKQALDILFDSLICYPHTTFIWYAAHLDVEVLLRDIPPFEKDKAFPSPRIERIKKHLREKITESSAIIKQSRDAREIDKHLHAQLSRKRALSILEYVYYQGYKIKVIQGKQLTIARGKHSVTIYDICSFFDKPYLPEVSRKFLGYSPPALDRSNIDAPLPLWDNEQTRAQHEKLIHDYIKTETSTLVLLANCIQDSFAKAGIELKRWYGISAAANRLLNTWKANKQFIKQAEENTPRELWRALKSAYYGGRIETLKLGTIKGGYVFDINAAYPFAATLLSKANRQWRFTKRYDIDAPFALWFVNYRLPDKTYLGRLPHRTSKGSTVYRQAGKGWYYAPEVREFIRRFPDCIEIEYGYVMPYSPVTFAGDIEQLYEHRDKLKQAHNPEEKLYKALLHAVCGKFSQTVGQPRFYCLAWAGWITSFVRAMLLDAINGQEHSVICFAQDAVHTQEPLKNVRISSRLGEWKREEFDKGTYLQSGVYNHANKGTKKRGLDSIDFIDAINNLNRGLNVVAEREFFVGWRLAQSQTSLRGELMRFMRPYGDKVKDELSELKGKYLEHVRQTVSLDPLAVNNRAFDKREFNWSEEFLDSSILSFNDGTVSRVKKDRDNMRRHNLMLDVVSARRF